MYIKSLWNNTVTHFSRFQSEVANLIKSHGENIIVASFAKFFGRILTSNHFGIYCQNYLATFTYSLNLNQPLIHQRIYTDWISGILIAENQRRLFGINASPNWARDCHTVWLLLKSSFNRIRSDEWIYMKQCTPLTWPSKSKRRRWRPRVSSHAGRSVKGGGGGKFTQAWSQHKKLTAQNRLPSVYITYTKLAFYQL